MTAKEKAEELFDKMLSKNPNRQDGVSMIDTIQAKLCALVAVGEVLKSHNNLYGVNSEKIKFYLEVKKEIEKL